MLISVGETCNASGPTWDSKALAAFSLQFTQHLAHFAYKVLNLGQGKHEEAPLFPDDSPDAVCRLLKKIVLLRLTWV